MVASVVGFILIYEFSGLVRKSFLRTKRAVSHGWEEHFIGKTDDTGEFSFR